MSEESDNGARWTTVPSYSSGRPLSLLEVFSCRSFGSSFGFLGVPLFCQAVSFGCRTRFAQRFAFLFSKFLGIHACMFIPVPHVASPAFRCVCVAGHVRYSSYHGGGSHQHGGGLERCSDIISGEQ